MANDWIKMRGGLFSSPKLIAMGKAMHEDRRFRDWLTPGGGTTLNGQIISDHALRCVTGALLTVTWSWSREYGKELDNGDCLLPHIDINGIDEIAGAPSVGAAMEAVGWAVELVNEEVLEGVILPKFFIEHNVPMSQAEKQRQYRRRKKESGSVTKTLPSVGNENGKNVTSREEKRREDITTPISPSKFKKPNVVQVADFCAQSKLKIDPQEFYDYYQAQGWKLSNGNAMKDWQAAVRKWARNKRNETPTVEPYDA
jgi:hypothetical protein